MSNDELKKTVDELQRAVNRLTEWAKETDEREKIMDEGVLTGVQELAQLITEGFEDHECRLEKLEGRTQ